MPYFSLSTRNMHRGRESLNGFERSWPFSSPSARDSIRGNNGLRILLSLLHSTRASRPHIDAMRYDVTSSQVNDWLMFYYYYYLIVFWSEP